MILHTKEEITIATRTVRHQNNNNYAAHACYKATNFHTSLTPLLNMAMIEERKI